MAASESLARLADGRRADNVAAAVVIHELQHLWEVRFAAEMELHVLGSTHPEEQPDTARARHTTECEAAVALSLSRTVTREMTTVANQLAWRLHDVDAAFSEGDLDYARVRTIALTLRRASDATVSAIEADILAAALRCNTRALTNSIWRQWIAHDPEEAAAARKAAVSEERCAEIRRGDDGMATLIAKMSLLEGAEMDALLEEMAGTVCARDPRTKKQLRGHALLALLRREESLLCTCGHGSCPMAEAAQHNPPRRKPLLQIHIDIETLLGLTNEPATLADGTVLDPETARLLATDARWQALLTEMIDAADQYRARQPVDKPDDDAPTDNAPDEHRPDEHRPDEHRPDEHRPDEHGDGGSAGRSSGGSKGNTPSERDGRRRGRARARRLVGRGRIRRAAALPPVDTGAGDTASAEVDPRAFDDAKHSTSLRGEETALTQAIAELLGAAATDPSLVAGPHPDGHGGFHEPPPGALTYRPNAELVALVRATHCTCTFPGCSVPAARCDLDHIVPFDHDDPAAGGWTVLPNLHPLCGYHHHAKTLRLWSCTKLVGDAVYWRSAAGLQRITPSTYGSVTIPESFVHRRPYHPSSATTATNRASSSPTKGTEGRTGTSEPPAPPDEIYEPTWWEMNMSDHDTNLSSLLRFDTRGGVPTLADIATLTDPEARADAIHLRQRFLEHRGIVAQRERFRPPPF